MYNAVYINNINTTYYPLTAPSIGLFIRYFLPMTKTQITGIEQTQAHAISSPHIVISLNELLNMVNPTAKVRMLSVFVTISGHIKLFHAETNVNILSVAIAGMAQGTPILKKVARGEHPSIIAASSSSAENEEKYCLIIKTPKPPNNPGTISA